MSVTNVKQACGKSEDGTRPPPQPPITSTPTAVQGLRSSSRSHPPSPLPARSSCRGGVWRDTAGSPVSPPESSPARTGNNLLQIRPDWFSAPWERRQGAVGDPGWGDPGPGGCSVCLLRPRGCAGRGLKRPRSLTPSVLLSCGPDWEPRPTPASHLPRGPR